MKEIHEEAGAALSKACDDMTCYADQHRESAPEYKISDKVWLSVTFILLWSFLNPVIHVQVIYSDQLLDM